ncbi:MAG: hypothetical protein H7A25_12435 [Leptospiraceae bacterium]|nr:hypothetical protein [Leptospiraceae bacterium]MCP5500707.1 hypothetical protein [Leptospiraceae bacterium]
MTWGFVFILPFSLGVITVYFASEKRQNSLAFRILMPWVSATVSLLLTIVTGLEGTICMIMALPIYLFMSSIGGVLTGIYLNHNSNRPNRLVFLSIFLFLPFTEARIENNFPLITEIRTVHSTIDIKANSKTVWSHITRIPKITEKQSGLFYTMGFPKPVEATLSHDGVGGIREAKFERGLMFLETITVWEENKRLIFTIKSDPEKTPLTTLDPHVVVGGDYFDTLLGKYEIEILDNNTIRLHLESKFRISTRFNFYAHLWSDFLMRDIQENILRVIKERCEK